MNAGAGRPRGGGIVLRVHRRRHLHPVLAGRLGAALLPADDHDAAVRVRRPRLRSLTHRRPDVAPPVLLVTAGLLAYALVLSLLSPFMPWHYRQSKIDAEQVTALVQAAPAPIYRTARHRAQRLALRARPDPQRQTRRTAGNSRSRLSLCLPSDQADSLLGARARQAPCGDTARRRRTMAAVAPRPLTAPNQPLASGRSTSPLATRSPRALVRRPARD